MSIDLPAGDYEFGISNRDQKNTGSYSVSTYSDGPTNVISLY